MLSRPTTTTGKDPTPTPFKCIQRIVVKAPAWRPYADVEALARSFQDLTGRRIFEELGLDDNDTRALCFELVGKVHQRKEPDLPIRDTFLGKLPSSPPLPENDDASRSVTSSVAATEDGDEKGWSDDEDWGDVDAHNTPKSPKSPRSPKSPKSPTSPRSPLSAGFSAEREASLPEPLTAPDVPNLESLEFGDDEEGAEECAEDGRWADFELVVADPDGGEVLRLGVPKEVWQEIVVQKLGSDHGRNPSFNLAVATFNLAVNEVTNVVGLGKSQGSSSSSAEEEKEEGEEVEKREEEDGGFSVSALTRAAVKRVSAYVARNGNNNNKGEEDEGDESSQASSHPTTTTTTSVTAQRAAGSLRELVLPRLASDSPLRTLFEVGSLDEERDTELLGPLLAGSFLTSVKGPKLLFGEGQQAGAAFVLLGGRVALRQRKALAELGSASVDTTVLRLDGGGGGDSLPGRLRLSKSNSDAGFVLGGELLGAPLEKANGGRDGGGFPKYSRTCVVAAGELAHFLVIPEATAKDLVGRRHAGSVGRFLDAARTRGQQQQQQQQGSFDSQKSRRAPPSPSSPSQPGGIAALSQESFEWLKRSMTRKEVGLGFPVTKQGARARSLFVLCRGELRVTTTNNAAATNYSPWPVALASETSEKGADGAAGVASSELLSGAAAVAQAVQLEQCGHDLDGVCALQKAGGEEKGGGGRGARRSRRSHGSSDGGGGRGGSSKKTAVAAALAAARAVASADTSEVLQRFSLVGLDAARDLPCIDPSMEEDKDAAAAVPAAAALPPPASPASPRRHSSPLLSPKTPRSGRSFDCSSLSLAGQGSPRPPLVRSQSSLLKRKLSRKASSSNFKDLLAGPSSPVGRGGSGGGLGGGGGFGGGGCGLVARAGGRDRQESGASGLSGDDGESSVGDCSSVGGNGESKPCYGSTSVALGPCVLLEVQRKKLAAMPAHVQEDVMECLLQPLTRPLDLVGKKDQVAQLEASLHLLKIASLNRAAGGAAGGGLGGGAGGGAGRRGTDETFSLTAVLDNNNNNNNTGDGGPPRPSVKSPRTRDQLAEASKALVEGRRAPSDAVRGQRVQMRFRADPRFIVAQVALTAPTEGDGSGDVGGGGDGASRNSSPSGGGGSGEAAIPDHLRPKPSCHFRVLGCCDSVEEAGPIVLAATNARVEVVRERQRGATFARSSDWSDIGLQQQQQQQQQSRQRPPETIVWRVVSSGEGRYLPPEKRDHFVVFDTANAGRPAVAASVPTTTTAWRASEGGWQEGNAVSSELALLHDPQSSRMPVNPAAVLQAFGVQHGGLGSPLLFKVLCGPVVDRTLGVPTESGNATQAVGGDLNALLPVLGPSAVLLAHPTPAFSSDSTKRGGGVGGGQTEAPPSSSASASLSVDPWPLKGSALPRVPLGHWKSVEREKGVATLSALLKGGGGGRRAAHLRKGTPPSAPPPPLTFDQIFRARGGQGDRQQPAAAPLAGGGDEGAASASSAGQKPGATRNNPSSSAAAAVALGPAWAFVRPDLVSGRDAVLRQGRKYKDNARSDSGEEKDGETAGPSSSSSVASFSATTRKHSSTTAQSAAAAAAAAALEAKTTTLPEEPMSPKIVLAEAEKRRKKRGVPVRAAAVEDTRRGGGLEEVNEFTRLLDSLRSVPLPASKKGGRGGGGGGGAGGHSSGSKALGKGGGGDGGGAPQSNDAFKNTIGGQSLLIGPGKRSRRPDFF